MYLLRWLHLNTSASGVVGGVPSSDKKRVYNWNKVTCPKNSNTGLRSTLHNDCSESFQSPEMKVT